MADLHSGASFRFIGMTLDSDLISRTLGVEPWHFHLPGAKDIFGNILDTGVWSMKSPLDVKLPIAHHLAWLTNVLEPHVEFLKEMKTQAKLDVFCSYTFDDDGGMQFTPESLRLILLLEINLEISILSAHYGDTV